MKTLFSYAALAIMILTSSFTLDTQEKLNQQTVNGFDYFRAHRQGKCVSMTWSMASSDVTRFVVERSYDGEFFETAGTVDFTGTPDYKFSDKTVYPGTIYYRITAVKGDASTESSSVETVRIVQRG